MIRTPHPANHGGCALLVSSGERASIGALEGGRAVQQMADTHVLAHGRESRRGRCQLNDSIGALELVKIGAACTFDRTHLWMLQLRERQFMLWKGGAFNVVDSTGTSKSRGARDVSSTGIHRGIGRGRSRSTVHVLTPLRRRESRREMMSVQRFQWGIGRGEPFNRWRGTHRAVHGESRGVRRCQFNDSIGALELPNGASALT